MTDLIEDGAWEVFEKLERRFPGDPPKPRQTVSKHAPLGLREVAEALAREEGGAPVSAERVRQIEQKALKKLRRWCARNGFRVEDFLDGYG